GGGGMGVVYKAHDTRLDRPVALKFLSPHLSADDSAKPRFIQEAQAASALDHPNICTIFEIGETEPAPGEPGEGRLFIAMAYYAGETLKKKIRRGALPVEEALDYAAQVAEGLSKAHERGIVHRDVKPANVMVTDEGVVKIVDFGLAKVAAQAQLTKTGSTMGTVAYMSPEQARGERIDHRTDLWSLGVVLYEMLTGERPFPGDYEQAIIYQMLNVDPVPVTRLNSDLPSDVEPIVQRCLQKHKDDRYQTATVLLADLFRIRRQIQSGAAAAHRSEGLAAVRESSPSGADHVEPARIFISYKRGAAPDDQIAEAIYDALSRRHDVFIDKLMPVGARWVEQIETELARSDFLIILLSARSIHSEMVLAEIEMAQRLAGARGGRPAILPVRVAYSEPFAYPLSAHLNDLNWAYWEGDEDTPRLVEQLTRAISGGGFSASTHLEALVPQDHDPQAIPEPLVAAQPPRLETPEGTMDPHSAFYVRRPEDELARRAIARQGVTITIKGPRQMGKSSLLVRMMNRATQAGKQVVFLDFQLFNQAALSDADTFFRQFCVWLTFKLKLKNRVDEYWQWPLGNSQCCTLYVEDCILKEMGQPLVLAMDEVERIFDTSFRSDFFSMLRSWHNDRANDPIWKTLDLALVTSTEPYQLIENLNQSPFNVGEIFELKDFTPEQVAELNHKHGAPLSSDEIQRLMALLSGHPYLTRKALYLVASGQVSMPDLLATATQDRGPFGDHLRYHLFRLHGHDDLIQGLREIIKRHTCADEAIFWRLQGAGLVLREGRAVVPRCTLYAEYFRDHFDG
ncbi:MAG: AAA-like domain-containing protein, partial [Bacteroidetes bacterium]|nr:AAA-like domain-containing protein [Bacteroidota bacterium]